MSKKSRSRAAHSALDDLASKLQQAATKKTAILKHLKEALDCLRSTIASKDNEITALSSIAKFVTSEEAGNTNSQDVHITALLCFLHLNRLHPQSSFFEESIQANFLQQLISSLKMTSKRSSSVQTNTVEVLKVASKASMPKALLQYEDGSHVLPLVSTLLDNFGCVTEDVQGEYQAAVDQFMLQLFAEEGSKDLPLLDTLVSQLIQSGQRQNPAATRFVQEFLQKHQQDLKARLQSWFNTQLAPGAARTKTFRQLPAILSQLLTHMEEATVDILVNSLSAEEGQERLLATQSLLIFLAKKGGNLNQSTSAMASQLLKRLYDPEVHVRAKVLEHVQLLLTHVESEAMRTEVLQHVQDRLRDVSPAVRSAAINSCARLLAARHQHQPETGIWREMIHRLRDTDVHVRRQSVKSFVGLFHHTCKRIAAGDETDGLDDGVLSVLPQLLTGCLTDMDLRVGLFEGKLLPSGMLFPANLPAAEAAEIWVRIHKASSSSAWEAVTRLLGLHCRFLTDVLRYSSLAAKSMKDSETAPSDNHQRTVQAVQKEIILHLQDMTESAQKGFKVLSNLENGSEVLDILLRAANPFTSVEENNAATSQLDEFLRAQSVDNKVLLQLLETLLKRSVPRLMTVAHMKGLLEAAQGPELADDVAALLAAAGKAAPILMLSEPDAVVDLVCKASRANTERYLRVLSAVAPNYRQLQPVLGSKHIPPVSKKHSKLLQQLCKEGQPKAGKACVLALHGFSRKSAEKDLRSLLDDLVAKMDQELPETPTVLMALGKLAQIMPGMFSPFIDRFVTFVIHDHLPSVMEKVLEQAAGRESKWGTFSSAAMHAAFAVKALVNSLLPEVKTPEDTASVQEYTSYVEMALEYLTSALERLVADPHQRHADLGYLRSVIAVRLLRLTRRYERSFLPSQYLELALVAQDPCLEARHQFVAKAWKMVHQLVQGGFISQLTAKLTAVLPLVGMDPTPQQRFTVYRHLQDFVSKRRTALQQQAASAGPSAASGGTSLSQQPEFLIPYFVYLLAHHPDYPEVGSPAKAYKEFVEAAQFAVAPLLANKTGQSTNVTLGIILKMLRSIKQTVVSTKGESSDAMYEVCDITMAAARSVAKDLNKGKEVVHEDYPGPVPLPKTLFDPTPKVDGAVRKKDGSHLPSGLHIPSFKEPSLPAAKKSKKGPTVAKTKNMAKPSSKRSPKKQKKSATPEAQVAAKPLRPGARAAAAAANAAMLKAKASDDSEEEDDYSDEDEEEEEEQQDLEPSPAATQPTNRKVAAVQRPRRPSPRVKKAVHEAVHEESSENSEGQSDEEQQVGKKPAKSAAAPRPKRQPPPSKRSAEQAASERNERESDEEQEAKKAGKAAAAQRPKRQPPPSKRSAEQAASESNEGESDEEQEEDESPAAEVPAPTKPSQSRRKVTAVKGSGKSSKSSPSTSKPSETTPSLPGSAGNKAAPKGKGRKRKVEVEENNAEDEEKNAEGDEAAAAAAAAVAQSKQQSKQKSKSKVQDVSKGNAGGVRNKRSRVGKSALQEEGEGEGEEERSREEEDHKMSVEEEAGEQEEQERSREGVGEGEVFPEEEEEEGIRPKRKTAKTTKGAATRAAVTRKPEPRGRKKRSRETEGDPSGPLSTVGTGTASEGPSGPMYVPGVGTGSEKHSGPLSTGGVGTASENPSAPLSTGGVGTASENPSGPLSGPFSTGGVETGSEAPSGPLSTVGTGSGSENPSGPLSAGLTGTASEGPSRPTSTMGGGTRSSGREIPSGPLSVGGTATVSVGPARTVSVEGLGTASQDLVNGTPAKRRKATVSQKAGAGRSAVTDSAEQTDDEEDRGKSSGQVMESVEEEEEEREKGAGGREVQCRGRARRSGNQSEQDTAPLRVQPRRGRSSGKAVDLPEVSPAVEVPTGRGRRRGKSNEATPQVSPTVPHSSELQETQGGEEEEQQHEEQQGRATGSERTDVPTQGTEQVGGSEDVAEHQSDDSDGTDSEDGATERGGGQAGMKGRVAAKAGKENRHGNAAKGLKASKNAAGKQADKAKGKEVQESPKQGAKKRGRGAAAQKQQVAAKKQRRGQSNSIVTADGATSTPSAGTDAVKLRRQPRRRG